MEPQLSTFSTILAYSIFIIASPIATFFVTKFFFFEGLLGVSSTGANIWSAVMAVVMLHIAMGLYIYRAYFEAERVKPEKVD
ncbi:hypothetical protein GWI33_018737 [Rhynchophorus ferrugineus]|uniref:Vacuolar ATPase assembly integral membrane protein VMA21 homolog n=1 Tax=Rhynchophorus ferrugineus TaxID=354439 RepID=A0A834HUA5_RHYFE|nr:hypothetical protein GWI33_018737 [Rhynchophorus ferrugineus]